MDSLFSFPVGLFHPLQHAGLSRRSEWLGTFLTGRIRATPLSPGRMAPGLFEC